jgi:hypothetical protein
MLTLQGEPPQLEREYHHRTFSSAMREVVAKCLQKEPGKRPSAKALLEHRWGEGSMCRGLGLLMESAAGGVGGVGAGGARKQRRRVQELDSHFAWV